MEKKLKRLTWLVSVAGFIIFCFMAVKYVTSALSSKELLDLTDQQLHKARADCMKVKIANDFAPTPEDGPCSLVAVYGDQFDSTAAVWQATSKKEEEFVVLTLFFPLGIWSLFFSLRWVLTGRKPWQRADSAPT